MMKYESALQGDVKNQLKTLDELTPRLTQLQKVIRIAFFCAAMGILVFSYFWCEIDPVSLWQKRQNAFEYLFGREPNEADKKVALRQAERLPEIVAYENARATITKQYEALPQSRQKDLSRKNQAIEKLAHELLAKQSPEDRERMIKEAYVRALDEKRGGFFPPETGISKMKSYLTALLETLMIAIWGSLLAFMAALCLSLFAARNMLEMIAPGNSRLHRLLRWVSYHLIRRFLDACRGFDMFVMALIFVAIIGLGPFAGILALFFHTTGVLGKVFSESIEAVDPGQVGAVLSTGAGAVQVISFAVLPQILPTMISYSLLRFESNVRSATILGFCGAGGIGFLLFDKLRGYSYREVCTMMIMIILFVTIVDYLCAKLRRHYI